jgi:hypothetical protein
MLTLLGTILAFIAVGFAIKLLSDVIGKSESKKANLRMRKHKAHLYGEVLRMSGFSEDPKTEQAAQRPERESKPKPER